MKCIGLLGGTSWPSTFSYYEHLNRGVHELAGGYHSARIILYSIDYHAIKSRYHDGWDEIPALLEHELGKLCDMRPDGIILCNNTLHRAYDAIEARLQLPVPFFHAGHLAAQTAANRGYRAILLLGTAFTMEDGFFARYFHAHQMNVEIPSAADREKIQAIQSRVAAGENSPEFRIQMQTILKSYTHLDAVVLACTELPLVIDATTTDLPLIDPAKAQCDAALAFIAQHTTV